MSFFSRAGKETLALFTLSAAIAGAFVGLTWSRRLPEIFRIRAGGPLVERSEEPGPSLKFTGARGTNVKPFRFAGRTLDVFYFDRVNQEGADFSGATILATNFSYATLPGANLRNADIRGSYFDHASLRNADLRGARLDHTNLMYSDLSGADLRNADLSSARIHLTRLEGTLFNGHTLLPFSRQEAEARGMTHAE